MTNRIQLSFFAAFVWMSALVCGCAEPTNWSPATVTLNERTEVPVAFPGRGLPTLLLNKPTDARNASLAILDTGSPFTTVSPRYVEAAKLEPRVESLRLKDAQGKERDYERVAHVKELKLGTA